MKNFFKNLSYLTLIQLSNALIPLLIIPYISRIIGVENFGSLETTRVYCYYFTIFINYGFDLTITREIALNKDDKEKINTLVNQTIYAKILLFFVSLVVFVFSLETYEAIANLKGLLILTFLINIGYVLYPIWFFQGIEKMGKVSIINFFGKLVVALLTIFLITVKSDYWLYNFFQSIGMIGVSIYCIYLLLSKYKIQFQSPNFSFIYNILKVGFPIFFGTILVTVITSLYFIFLQSHSNAIEIAKFSTTNKLIATLQLLILLPFSQAFFPLINTKFAEGKVVFTKYLNVSAIALFVITFIQGLIVFLFPEFFLKMVFGDEFIIAKECVKVLAFLPMFAALTNVFGYQGLLTLKKDKQFLYIHILFAFFCVVANLIFISSYDSLVAAYIRLFTEILLFVVCFIVYIYIIRKWKK